MTEDEWLTCTDVGPMLGFLIGKAGDRKLRLFAAGCCRQIWELLRRRESRRAVEVAEEFADGGATPAQLKKAERAARRVADELAFEANVMMRLPYYARRDAAEAAAMAAWRHLAPHLVAARAVQAVSATPKTPRCQCSLLRCGFGPLPFRPVALDPAWGSSATTALAEVIYRERVFERLPLLADALEEAGCANDEILGHCRRHGEHARGCWVVDLFLGKD